MMYEDYKGGEYHGAGERYVIGHKFYNEDIFCKCGNCLVTNQYSHLGFVVPLLSENVKNPICINCYDRLKEEFNHKNKTHLPFVYEDLPSQNDLNAVRVKVFGGWLVTCAALCAITTTFISDPDHEWMIK